MEVLMYISNEEIFFVDYEKDSEKIIIYAPLRSYMALISKKNMEIFLSDSTSDVRKMLMGKITNRPLIDVNKILSDLQRVTQELSIPITDDCNLRCTYCHASAGEEHKKESMDEVMIDSILKCYFNNINENTENVKINFTGGGEPTYEFNKLSYAINKAKDIASQRNIKCAFTMATNGCYGQDIREYITRNFSEVSLSFDGTSHIQNLHRPFANGHPSFEHVYATAKYFYEVKFPFALRSTISDYSLNYLEEIIDFFEHNFPGVHLGLEPLIVVGRAIRNTIIKAPDAKKFGDELIKVFDYTDKKNIDIANSAASEYTIVRPVFCSGVGIPNWTVLMTGEIVCCSRDGAPDEFTFGRLNFKDSTVFIDEFKLNNIRNMNVLSYDQCADCFAKYHCAGDCPDRRLSSKSDCDSLKKVGQFILNKKINA